MFKDTVLSKGFIQVHSGTVTRVTSMESPLLPSQSEVPQSHSTLKRLKALLRQLLRVTVSDGRIFLGTFAGTDQPLNLLLVNAEEFRQDAEENFNSRYVGQIVIPWKLVVKVEGEVRNESRHTDSQMYH